MAPSDWLCRLTRVFVLALFSTMVSSTMSAQTDDLYRKHSGISGRPFGRGR